MIQPIQGYVYGEEIKKDNGIVSTSDVADTKQHYKVLAVGPGHYEHGALLKPTVKPGDVVIIQKHAAEGDTPTEMLADGRALFLANRVMAKETE